MNCRRWFQVPMWTVLNINLVHDWLVFTDQVDRILRMLEAARNLSRFLVGRNKKGNWHVWMRTGNGACVGSYWRWEGGGCDVWFELLAFMYNILIAEFLLLHPLPQDYAYIYKKGYYLLVPTCEAAGQAVGWLLHLPVVPHWLRHITFTFRSCEISPVIECVAAVKTDLYQTMVKSGLHNYMCLLYKMYACNCMSKCYWLIND